MNYVAKKLKVAKMGEKILRTNAEKVSIDEIKSRKMKETVEDMYFTMKQSEDGIGLAAPQVFIPKQIVIIEIKEMNVPKLVMFNPIITECKKSGMIRTSEGCISVPGIVGDVERFAKIKLSYLDENATKREAEATGFVSAALQHEIDHLFSTLFVDRTIPHTMSFTKEWTENILPLFSDIYCQDGDLTFIH